MSKDTTNRQISKIVEMLIHTRMNENGARKKVLSEKCRLKIS